MGGMSHSPWCSPWLLASSLAVAAGGCSDPPASIDDASTTSTSAGPSTTGETDGADETSGSCPSPLLSCTGACVDPMHDPIHCGGCDQACAADMACIDGSCDVACGPGLLTCAGACVDPQYHPAHCGGCDRPCAPEALCQTGICVASCEPPAADCTGSCRNLDNDEQHCGACDAACPAGQPCVGGQCVAASLHHVLITGQSLSQGALSEVVSTEQPFDNVSFATGVRAGGVGLASLVPLVETSDGFHGETLASGLANLMSERAIAAGREHRSLFSAHGVSGQPYAALQKGTAPYADGMAQVAAGLALAQAQGDEHAIRAMVVIHGESDHINGNLTYDQDLLEWQSDYEADIQAMTGQTLPVPLVTDQMSSFTAFGAATSVIPLLQLSASRAEPERIILMGPKYVQSYVADGVHLTGDGERWLGEMHAKVLERILVDGEPWRPLSPREITRDGAEITLRLWAPVPPLVLDDVTVSDPGNHGFGYFDNSGAAPSITAVTLMGEDTVRITLSDVPVGGNRRLTYAMFGIPGQPAGPMTGARGTLRDSDATQSRHGYALHNWCVHFDEAVP